MHPDVVELRNFYARPLGGVVRRLLAHRLRARWRRVHGLTVIGLGFAAPYLGSFRSEAEVLGAMMPAEQGALVWPPTGDVHTVLTDDDALPLADASVDRLLAVHWLETCQSERPLLREMWRVLAPEGRLLLIVPNRRGVWARMDSTPFGHGRPYSRAQIESLLSESLFTPIDWSVALMMPPIEREVVMRSAMAIERVGSRLWPAFAGLILVEARKELMAPAGGTPVKARRSHVLAGQGVR